MKVVIRSAARADILNQYRYLVDQNVPHAAERFIDAVDETILKLAKSPQIGAPKKLMNPRLRELRQWPVKGFETVQIYYLTSEDLLKVIRVLHGKRDVDRILRGHHETENVEDIIDEAVQAVRAERFPRPSGPSGTKPI